MQIFEALELREFPYFLTVDVEEGEIVRVIIDDLNSRKPEDLKRIFIIVGGIIYSEEEVPEAMLIEEKSSANLVKMGRLNNGFTLFDDRNYSTRIIVKDRVIQGIELFVRNNDEMPSLRIKSPIIHEDKISEEGDMEKLINSFEIPDSMPDIEATEGENQNKNT